MSPLVTRSIAAFGLFTGLLSGLLLGLLAACSSGPRLEGPAAGKNLLLVTLDTTRADALSCYDAGPEAKTPVLSKLAEEGALFERAYSETNVTKPSHVSIHTGQHAIRHRVFNNAAQNPDDLVTLPLLFRRAGYRTAGFTSAVHLSFASDWPGIETLEGPPAGQEQRGAVEVTRSAMKWLKENGDERFFLWVHYFDPHILYTPPPRVARSFYDGDPRAGDAPLLSEIPYVVKRNLPHLNEWISGLRDPAYPKAMYAAEVYLMDREIGKLFDQLGSDDRADDTVTIVVADHGEAFGEHGVFYDHLGLYEDTLHVPLIVHVPGFPAGLEIDTPVSHLDIAPTVAELFGLPGLLETGGRSLVGLLQADEKPFERDGFIHEAAHNRQVAYRRGRFKYVHNMVDLTDELPRGPMLFDLAADPDETRDVKAEHPELAAELGAKVEPWVLLGVIKKGDQARTSPEILEQLRALGYVDAE